jgi:two-component system, LytTR family, sensor kinase
MKIVWYQKKWVAVLVHLAAWALLFSLPYLLSSPEGDKASHPPGEEGMRRATTYFTLVMNGSWMVYFYFNAYIVIPRLVFTKKYRLFVLAATGCLLVMLTEFGLLTQMLFHNKSISQRGILFNLFIFLFFFALSTAYQLINDKVKSDKLAQEKLNENLKTELSLLRSQVSPHFMFNVLNNMVALARKQSDQLEPSLIKLSSLMRYMLYEADEEKVSLEKEIEYLQSYIDLQQQRFGKKVHVQVDMHSLDRSYLLEPMLLIPFVENAFKHGTGMIEDAQIDITLKAENNLLSFTVRNKFNPETNEIKDASSGIGLTNVKRRLNLLYGNKHTLLITEKEPWFIVSLQIFLS